VGFAGFLKSKELAINSYEISFVLQNKGYATELGKAQIEYALKKLDFN
jgi:RimJ/RimL family protein N-acetyltransferase